MPLRQARWTERFADLLAAHALADFVLQTERQARLKAGGLTGPAPSRRALASHVGVYTLSCGGVLAGIARRRGPATAAAAGAAIAIPHALVDDRRLLAAWMRRVKHADPEASPAVLTMVVDQAIHLLSLWALARALGDDRPAPRS